MSEKTNTNVKKTYTDPVTGKFIPGNPGGGRPKGSISFATKWKKFIEKIADNNEVEFDDVERELLSVAYKQAKAGNFSFYKDIFDRVYGKAKDEVKHSGAIGMFSIKDFIELTHGSTRDTEGFTDVREMAE
ncbi:MAG TPA: hypothetical protein DHN29_05555 [Cytophagales bacterium]|jgi:hypothetical protein|nr:hypothetical protein [Cytophagales bacterium]|tara:strand:+ start:11654 stop:12046 length:393 start_codon:yes stop_codon:yes gene_type:complete